MTEEDIIAVIDKGRRAGELLDNDTLTEALAALREDYTRRWAESRSTDIDGREANYHALQGLLAFEAILNGWLEHGKAEAARLEKQRQRDEAKAARQRRFGVV